MFQPSSRLAYKYSYTHMYGMPYIVYLILASSILISLEYMNWNLKKKKCTSAPTQLRGHWTTFYFILFYFIFIFIFIFILFFFIYFFFFIFLFFFFAEFHLKLLIYKYKTTNSKVPSESEDIIHFIKHA